MPAPQLPVLLGCKQGNDPTTYLGLVGSAGQHFLNLGTYSSLQPWLAACSPQPCRASSSSQPCCLYTAVLKVPGLAHSAHDAHLLPLAVTGLSAPVPRGRKGKKTKNQMLLPEIKNADWLATCNPEVVLHDDSYKKHLKQHCNK